MQDNGGLKSLLNFSWCYRLLQFMISRKDTASWFINDVWGISSGEKVVDLGCGPASIFESLPDDIDYYGVDFCENYIQSANQKYGNNGTFICSSATDIGLKDIKSLKDADVVICHGLLHHLDDRGVESVLDTANKILKRNGRMVCFEPCFLKRQGRVSEWLMRKDRGQNVRTEQEWKSLVSSSELVFKTSVITGLNRIPWIHIIIEGRRA